MAQQTSVFIFTDRYLPEIKDDIIKSNVHFLLGVKRAHDFPPRTLSLGSSELKIRDAILCN